MQTPPGTIPVPPARAAQPPLALRAAPAIGLAGGIAFALAQLLVFFYAPVEQSMGLAQKIFYLHIPLAWWGLFSFFLNFVASILYLARRTPFWDALGAATAGVGFVYAVLALGTGMFWGRFAWGVWWTWDARLSTTLVMCFIYGSYILLRAVEMPAHKRSAVAAVVGVVAFLDVPLVYFSARLWSYIHPSSIEMTKEMGLTLLACVAAMGVLWLGITLLRLGLALDEHTLHFLQEKQILQSE